MKTLQFAAVVWAYLGFTAFVSSTAAAQSLSATLAKLNLDADFVVLARASDNSEGKMRQDDKSVGFVVEKVLKQPNEHAPGDLKLSNGSRFATSKDRSEEDVYVVFGKVNEDALVWSTAWGIAQDGMAELMPSMTNSAKGVERLLGFYPMLTSPARLISRNAQLEFASASQEDFDALEKLELNSGAIFVRLRKLWSQHEAFADGDKDLASSIRFETKILFAVLAKCGTKQEGQWVGKKLQQAADSGADRTISTATLSCYLQLVGEGGLPLIENLYLKNTEDFAATYKAIVSLRYFVSRKSSPLSRESLTSALRMILKKQELADLVIMDLARLQDWESTDRLTAIADNPSVENWCRVPVINFLRICPTAKAKQKLNFLREKHSSAYERAKQFYSDATLESMKNRAVRIRPARPSGKGFRC
ncbi:MAG: hypothetical protein AAF483_05605 [Planctomycetota bacterium]